MPAAPRAVLAQDTANAVRTDTSITTADGYARIVFHFDRIVDADVRLSGSVLVVAFRSQVNIDVNRLAAGNDYVGAARVDPDGRGVRLALAQKVRVNSMAAGERLFVDLLPDSWTGPPPPLPQEVVEDLARRARAAAREAEARNRPPQPTMSRVRVSRQPTFTRYVFELPEFIPVNSERGADSLKLTFDAPLRFDLTDARTMQPPMVRSINAASAATTTSVTLALVGNVDIRTFREDNNYVLDVVATDLSSRNDDAVLPALAKAPQTIPAQSVSVEPIRAETAPVPAAPPSVPAAPSKPPVPPGPAAAVPDKASPVAAAAVPAPAGPAAVPLADNRSSPVAVAPPRPPEAAAGYANAAPSADPNRVAATLERQGDTLRLILPFPAPTPAAAFMRADTVWLLFDTATPIDLAAVKDTGIREASATTADNAQLVGIKLDRPRLVSLALDGATWTVHIADTVIVPPQPLVVTRNAANQRRASAQVPFENPQRVHRIRDPEVGDTVVVVTGLGPPRGIPKTQEFVDFRTFASMQGVAIQMLADDVRVELATDRVVIGRPNGLTMTSASVSGLRGVSARASLFDPQQWGFDRQADFIKRENSLITAAALAPEARRYDARMELARFYFARDMYAEAKGVLDVAIADEKPGPEVTAALVMRGLANILMDHVSDGLKDLSAPSVGVQNDAPLWRAMASARLGNWPDANESFRKVDMAIGALPLELQRAALKDGIRAALAVKDFGAASGRLDTLEALGVPPDEEAAIAVLTGRLQEGINHGVEALAAYRVAANSLDRAAAAEGKLHEVSLRYRLGDLKRPEVISELEALTTAWRGDETEAEALQILAQLYTAENRYRDAFTVMRTAVRVHPDLPITRAIQDEAAATFDSLFLGGKGDGMPAIEALGLFYDFRELTPIGRRGDEMIRRLADRLVSVDLLAQAAELLQHQVDHRLEGAARAQVATRLAAIYLLNRQPDRALRTLKSTRTGDLSSEVRNQRLLLEARALSDIGRPNLALEVIENVPGSEAIRMRADVLWTAKRYGEAAEQIELLYNDRWHDWRPFDDTERRDILRGAIGYNLAGDTLGLSRFREKFSPGMMQSVDRRAFEAVSAPQAKREDFEQVVRMISAVDPLDRFLRDLRPGAATTPAPTADADMPPATHVTRQRADMTPTGTVNAVE